MAIDRQHTGDQASPQESINIGIGEYEVTTTGAELVTHGLGSCVSITLFDQFAGVAGLIHVKRPSQDRPDPEMAASFADSGIELLVEEMVVEGASKHRLTATIAGGSNICNFTHGETCIGERNVIQSTETLEALGIDIVEKDTGGTDARSVYFDGETGLIVIDS